MRSCISVLTLAGLTVGAGAQTVVEFDNVQLKPTHPEVFTVIQEDPGPLLGFTWDLTFTAITHSWGSELIITLAHESGYKFTFDGSDGNLFDLGPADVEFGWANEPGVFHSAGTHYVQDGPSETLGEWKVIVYDEFPNVFLDVEGKLNGTLTINKVPAPGALGVLGCIGLAQSRRRRR